MVLLAPRFFGARSILQTNCTPAHSWTCSRGLRNGSRRGLERLGGRLTPAPVLSLSDCRNRYRFSLASHCVIGKPLSRDGTECKNESVCIVHLAHIESKGFFVKVSEQVKRFDRNIRATDAAYGSLGE
jgi:hypothetical protein